MFLNDDCVHLVVEYVGHIHGLCTARTVSRQFDTAVADVLVFLNGKCRDTLDGTNLQARKGHIASGIDGPAVSVFRLAAITMRPSLRFLRTRDDLLPFALDEEDHEAVPLTICDLLPQLEGIELREVHVAAPQVFRHATALQDITFAGSRVQARGILSALAANGVTRLRAMRVQTFPQTHGDLLEALCAEEEEDYDDCGSESADSNNNNGGGAADVAPPSPTLVVDVDTLAFHSTDRISKVSLALPRHIALQIRSLSFAVFEGVGSHVNPLATLPVMPCLEELRIKSLPAPARIGALRSRCPSLRVLVAFIDNVSGGAGNAVGTGDEADSWPGLERLELDGTPEDGAVSGMGGAVAPYRCLSGSAATLRHLALSGSGWGTEDFMHVASAGMPALEILYVPSCRRIETRAWRALAGFPALTNLDVTNTSFDDASLRFVADGVALPVLRALAATLCVAVTDLSPLAGHRTLEWLAVSFAGCRNLWPLTTMVRLHTLSLTGIPPSMRDAQPPPPAPVDVVGMPGCPADVSALSQCGSLTSIAMRGGCVIEHGDDPFGLANVDAEADATAAFCRGMRVLDVRDCVGVCAAPWLRRLRGLEFLTLPSADDRLRGVQPAAGDGDGDEVVAARHVHVSQLPRLRHVEL